MPRETLDLHAPVLAAPPADTPAAKPKTARKAKTARAAKRKSPSAAQLRPFRPGAPIVPLIATPDASLGYRLMTVAHLYATTLAAALRATSATRDLTVPQLQTLQLMAANPDIYGAELAYALGVQPQTMTTISGSLSAQGLILIQEQVSGQGRARKLVLTAEGKAMLAHGRKVAKKVDKKLAHAYSYDGREAEALADMLTQGWFALAPDAR